MTQTQQRGRRRLDASVPPEYDVPTRGPRLESARTARLVLVGTIATWVLATLVAATSVVSVPAVPDVVQRPAAAVLLVVFSLALTHRVGGHLRIWTVSAVVLGVAALATSTVVLLSAAAATTAILATVMAVMGTRPAETLPGVLREYGIALAVAISGTIGVAAWNAPVNYQRFNLVVLAVSLGLAIALVWNLGAGLHGLGRQNLLILVGVAAVLVIVLAYSSFVRTHGSKVLVDAFSDSVIWMRSTIGGVPRPVEVFIGFPALIAGVSLRSRRREGWWVLVFAVLGTGVLTTSLVSPGAYPSYIGLSTLYSVVLGLGVGLGVRHVVMNDRSSRAARAIVPESRVEPPRTDPLK